MKDLSDQSLSVAPIMYMSFVNSGKVHFLKVLAKMTFLIIGHQKITEQSRHKYIFLT